MLWSEERPGVVVERDVQAQVWDGRVTIDGAWVHVESDRGEALVSLPVVAVARIVWAGEKAK